MVAWKQGYLLGTHHGDPFVAAVALVLLFIVVIASVSAARRATRVDPAVVLRAE